jgi:hypothetical protein
LPSSASFYVIVNDFGSDEGRMLARPSGALWRAKRNLPIGSALDWSFRYGGSPACKDDRGGTAAMRKQRSFADDGKSVKSTAADRRGRQHEDGAMAYSDGEFPQDLSRKKATRQ